MTLLRFALHVLLASVLAAAVGLILVRGALGTAADALRLP